MRILVVNVNTTDSMTGAIGRQAAAVAAPGTDIVPLTPDFGAESVEGNYESHLAAVGHGRCGPFRAVRCGDPGGLRRTRSRRITGTARRAGGGYHRSGRQHGAFLGRTFGRDHPGTRGAADRGSPHARGPGGPLCLGTRDRLGVLDLERDPPRRSSHRRLLRGRRRSGSCRGGLSRLRRRGGCRRGWSRASAVVDGVAAAVTVAESLVRLGLRVQGRRFCAAAPKTLQELAAGTSGVQ